MQPAFCTNCGQHLTPGAAFCGNCGTRVEAPPVDAAATATNSVPPGTGAPPSIPPSTPQVSFAPSAAAPPSAPAPAQQNQAPNWLGWIAGCLIAVLAVVALLIGLLTYGLVSHQWGFFAVGLVGLALLFIIGSAIEHRVRRLYRRFRGTVGVVDSAFDLTPDSGSSSRPYQQPSFSLFRFLFLLVFMAGLTYGGLYLYYTQQFVGEWSGVLKIGTTQQGILTTLQIALPLHSPTHPSFSDPASLAVTQVEFKQTAAQACKGSPKSYQLSGSASRLDASDVTMTLTVGKDAVLLHGTYDTARFTLTGKNAQGQPVTLTLAKGSNQVDYIAACK